MEGGGGRLSNALKMISSKIRWKRNVNGAKKGTKSALDKMKKVSEKVKKVKTKPFFNKISEKFKKNTNSKKFSEIKKVDTKFCNANEILVKCEHIITNVGIRQFVE